MSTIKAVEIISDTNIGGAGVLLLNRTRYSDREKIETTVILPENSRLKQRFEELHVKTLSIKGCADRSFDMRAIPRLAAALRKLSPDLVNCHSSLSGRITARIVGVPTVIYTRHCVFDGKKSLLSRAQVVFEPLLSDRIIAVAYAVRDYLLDLGIPRSRISVIINGAEELKRLPDSRRSEIRKRLKIGAEKTVVTICARLESCKDHATFLKAAKLLSSRSEKYCFLIIGGGSLEKDLRQYAKRLGIYEQTRFVGAVADVTPYMNVTDINVNCSIGSETSSLALSEGMSLCIPCVASDFGGNTYMVEDGVNGYIFRRGDYRALARKIELLADPCIYARMSTDARARFERELNAERMTRDTERLYCDLVRKNGYSSRIAAKKPSSSKRSF